ncbi:MAG: hypothetical protein IPK44_15245 [Candidatus Accumulibacter sp.]|uniref:calcium-binding protein n=1 Tax=Accumulibacter sp. TaxID=2053492 RepID=UPI00258D5E17|nr:hypothetical protein [Accumulibacter sp.]MBK8115749.1 hypothetical protein [Accumulibacter sp.]
MTAISKEAISIFQFIENVYKTPGDIANTIQSWKDLSKSKSPDERNHNTISAIVAGGQLFDSYVLRYIEVIGKKNIPGGIGIALDAASLGISINELSNDAINKHKIETGDVLNALSSIASIAGSLALVAAAGATAPAWLIPAAIGLTATGIALGYGSIIAGDRTIDLNPMLQSLSSLSSAIGDDFNQAYKTLIDSIEWTSRTIEEAANSFAESTVNLIDQLENILAEAISDGYYDATGFLNDFLNKTGDWFGDTASDFQSAIAAALRRLIDPIIVDMDGDGIELTPRSASNVVFDMDGDGVKEWTGWIGKDDAFLVIDANNNGKIDSIAELIGDQNRSGFTELSTYDSNSDHILNTSDSTWSKLRLWRDVNSNGLTDNGELLTLAEGGIKSIDLHYTTVNFTAEGNRIHESSIFEKIGGGVGTLVDAWLDVNNFAQKLGVITTNNTTVDALPNIRNYGDVSTLRQAMLTDAALTTLVNTVINLQPNQLAGIREQVEQILFRWADTNDVAIDSRGPNFDGRILATLEKFLGTPYWAGGNSNPIPQAVPNLTRAWSSIVDGIESRLLLAGPLKAFLPSTVYDLGADRFITLGTIDEVLSGVKIGQPTTDTLARAKYWSALIPVINRLAEDSGIDSNTAVHRNKIITALDDIGLGKFQDLLHAGIVSAVLPASGILDKNGVYQLSDTADTAFLTGSTQAVFGLGGNDRLTASDPYSPVMLDGGDGDDVIYGSEGADWLDGGKGADQMIGYGGDDTYLVDNAGDTVSEAQNGGADTVKASVDWTLGDNFENLVLLGTAALKGTGNALDNQIAGNGGANTLAGGGGGDSLDGGAGADAMAGGVGTTPTPWTTPATRWRRPRTRAPTRSTAASASPSARTSKTWS